jgi:hypothetical protein
VKRERVLYDHNENVLYRHYVEDVEPHIDLVAAQRSHLNNGFAPHKRDANYRKIASIPMIVLDQWFREGFNAFDKNNAKELKRRINEYNKFRTVDKPL